MPGLAPPVAKRHGAGMAKSDSTPGPDFSIEHALMAGGLRRIAGVDEAGRGPLAGPVVVSAVVLDPANIPQGLNDSKKLTPKRRDALFEAIMATAEVSIITAPPKIIDLLNIRGATLWGMCQAVLGLSATPDHVLIDGRDIPEGLPCPADYLIGGDGRSVSIAAASIIAKVMRDRMCPIMDSDHPGFSFAKHKGYGTAVHMSALTALGPTDHHRKSFAPVLAATRSA
ncbi:ribonuclease HII [Mariluticola halotolerans]|uniref:ribonuclease HII n=1 Tax=Mariluticola halotolerans TaxID=2909283 RepID=UPI0026E18966|nr:ribonuclease HII [Mariluticola halotolerans]UJQ95827.1 ribonuclease HII [Mariluticola halotolerans]